MSASAPILETNDIEYKLPMVDLAIEGDGIDDDIHNVDLFLQKIGTGCKDLNPPNFNQEISTSWPKLPQEVIGIDDRFFRKPDFVTDGNNNQQYLDKFSKKADELGWIRKRNRFTKFGRYIAGSLISATIVGNFYLASQYTRIHVGHIGFCTDINESVRLLLPGHHCEFNPTHGSIETFPIVNDYITYLTRAHIIRVHPGEYVVVKINDQYTLLLPGDNHSVGVHLFDDPRFEFVQRVKQTNPAILAGPINIITVPPGHLAKILIQNKPYILFEGQHHITSGLLEFGERILSDEEKKEEKNSEKKQNQNMLSKDNLKSSGFSSLKETFRYYAIGKVYVEPGVVIGIKINKKAIFLEKPGDYWFYSDQFEMSDPVSKIVDFFQFSSLFRVFVKENEFGIVQKSNGSLQILGSGCHIVEVPNKYLASIPKTIQYANISNLKGITADPLDVLFNFTLAYRIRDPFKAYLLGTQIRTPSSSVVDKNEKKITSEINNKIFETIHNSVVESCTRTMKDIVRNLVFKNMMQLHRLSNSEIKHEQQQENQPGSLKEQYKLVSTAAIHLLTKTLYEVFGIELIAEEFGISQLDLERQTEQNELSKAAFEASKAKVNLIKAENDKKVAEYNKIMAEIAAETKVSEKLIEAKAQGAISKMMIEAKVNEEKMKYNAEAEKMNIMAEAKSKEIILIAKAEAEAIKLKGDADGYAISQFSDRTQLQIVEHISQMFKNTTMTMIDSKDGIVGPLLVNMLKTLHPPQ